MEQHLKNIGRKYAQNKGVEDAYIEGGNNTDYRSIYCERRRLE